MMHFLQSNNKLDKYIRLFNIISLSQLQSIYLFTMKSFSLEKQTHLLDNVHTINNENKLHIYKLKCCLPQIKTALRENSLLNLTRQAFTKNQMLYLDFYQASGIRILQHSPQPDHEDEDDNQTFGKVKVVELANLSQRCKKTLSYFTTSKDQKMKRDTLRKSLSNKFNTIGSNRKQNKEIFENQQDQLSPKQSPVKRIHMNVFQRNRKLPKREKYLIQKLGINTGDHMFKVNNKSTFSKRFSTPQNERKQQIAHLPTMLGMRRRHKQGANSGRLGCNKGQLQSSKNEFGSPVFTDYK